MSELSEKKERVRRIVKELAAELYDLRPEEYQISCTFGGTTHTIGVQHNGDYLYFGYWSADGFQNLEHGEGEEDFHRDFVFHFDHVRRAVLEKLARRERFFEEILYERQRQKAYEYAYGAAN